MAEQNMRSVHREACGPQGRPHSPKHNAASSNTTERSATVSTHWKPIQRNRQFPCKACLGIGRGRDSGGTAGVVTGRGTYAEKHRELGRPRGCPEQGAACRSVSGGEAEPKREANDAPGGVGLPHGTRRAGEPFTWGRGQRRCAVPKGNTDRTVGSDKPCKPHWEEQRTKRGQLFLSIAEASISEEPGAGIPHAGICAGGVRQLAFLPRSSPANPAL